MRIWFPKRLLVDQLKAWQTKAPHIATLPLPQVKPSARIIEPHEANILQFVGGKKRA